MSRILLLSLLVGAFHSGLNPAQGQTVVTFLHAEAYRSELDQLDQSFRWIVDQPTPPEVDTTNLWTRWKLVENYTFGKNRGNLPMIADLQSLHPYFRDKVIELIEQCRKQGIELAVVESYRTHTKQNEYMSMGKRYTRSAGGSSKHQYGLAVDVVPIQDSLAVWNNLVLWKKIGLTGERLGLRWGGRWRHPYDPGHFEWTGGLTSTQFAQGKFPTLPVPDQYPCIDEDLQKLARFWKAWEIEQSAMARQVRDSKGKTAMK